MAKRSDPGTAKEFAGVELRGLGEQTLTMLRHRKRKPRCCRRITLAREQVASPLPQRGLEQV
jgi:hypothetical protein